MDAQMEWETCSTCGQDVGFCADCERLRKAIQEWRDAVDAHATVIAERGNVGGSTWDRLVAAERVLARIADEAQTGSE